MGVVNATPDSFSDGGRGGGAAAAGRWGGPPPPPRPGAGGGGGGGRGPPPVLHGLQLAAQGAAWLDVGGESTRPGAQAVPEDVELARILPVIRGLASARPLSVRLAATSPGGRGDTERWSPPPRGQGDPEGVEGGRATFAISIDTMKPAVARAAVAAGATMWNDVDALRAPGALETAAELGCEVVLMHMRGEPGTMQDAPAYDDALSEVEDFLLARAQAAVAAGVAPSRIWFDPGIGFGKRLAHNLEVLRGLRRLAGHGHRVLLGASRKRTVRAIDPTAVDPLDRLGGSLALHLWGAIQGVAAVRAHDVRETVQALAVWNAVSASSP